MLRKIISGGQTGVDQAGLYAAQILGIETGGVAPQGWTTEDGPQQELLQGFGLVECLKPGYPARTEANVRIADCTLIISPDDFDKLKGGTYDTLCVCESLNKPVYQVQLRKDGKWAYRIRSGSKVEFKIWTALFSESVTLNVAGPRRSKCSWIEEKAAEWIVEQLS